MNAVTCTKCGATRGANTSGDGWIHEPGITLCFTDRKLATQRGASAALPGQSPIPGL